MRVNLINVKILVLHIFCCSNGGCDILAPDLNLNFQIKTTPTLSQATICVAFPFFVL